MFKLKLQANSSWTCAFFVVSLEQLKAVVQENNLKREEEVYASAMSSKEKESLLENERNMISTKLAEINEDQNKKMLQKEIRLREDAQAKFVLLEKVRFVRLLFCNF